MRPFLAHLSILAVLAVPGIAAFIQETMAPPSYGGLFLKYDLTKLYWLGLLVVAITSSTIVGFVFGVQKLRIRPFTSLTVILCHVLPSGLLGLSMSLGVHDMIQETWRNTIGKPASVFTSPDLDAATERPSRPLSAPLKPFPLPTSSAPALQPKPLE